MTSMSEHNANVRVAGLMGSATDWDTMKRTSETLKKFGIAHDCQVISAHRQPDRPGPGGDERHDRQRRASARSCRLCTRKICRK